MPFEKCYCNVLAMEKGLDPVGSAGSFDDAVIMEVPLPWKINMYQEAGALPQEIINLLGLWLQHYHEGRGYPHRPLLVAPDESYSQPGMRRVMHYTRTAVRYEKREYLVPDALFGPLVWALFEAPDDLPRFERYRDTVTTRDLLVCTHGTVDAACAKFGYPLYSDLRNNHASQNLRVWRVSHFGGHVFAPTLMDMPTGHYWAYVDSPRAVQIANQSGEVQELYGHYRGWAGLESGFLQAAERELWMKYGWEWFDYAKAGQIIAKDEEGDEPGWAEVQIDYNGGLTTGVYTARVNIRQHIHTPGNTASEKEHPYPQYTVKEHQHDVRMAKSAASGFPAADIA